MGRTRWEQQRIDAPALQRRPELLRKGCDALGVPVALRS